MAADHFRYVIRQAIVTALANAGTLAGARVYDHPYDDRTVFPALVVEDEEERQEAKTMPAGPARPIDRFYLLWVRAEVQQSADAARVRDQLTQEAEACLATLAIVGVRQIKPVGWKATGGNAGEKPIRVGHQLFEVTYRTSQGNPSAHYQ